MRDARLGLSVERPCFADFVAGAANCVNERAPSERGLVSVNHDEEAAGLRDAMGLLE